LRTSLPRSTAISIVLRVLSRERERRLREIVRTEGKELRVLSKPPRPRTGTYCFDHRAKLEVQLFAQFLLKPLGELINRSFYMVKLLGGYDLRNHDLGTYVYTFPGTFGGRLEYCLDLHGVYLGVGNANSHTAMAEHRIDLLQLAGFEQHSLFLG